MSPAISVLMSVRDGMPYLPLAVKSILDQSFTDFEFIIVDDHSTDGTMGYLNSLSDPRLKLVSSPAQGQTKALNIGLETARGEWIARMDGDDWSRPDRLTLQREAAQAHPQANLISADYELCDETLNPVSDIHLNTRDPGFLIYLRERQNPFCHPVMMFRREAVQALGGYDERLTTAQDFALWRSLLANGPLAHVPEPLLKYRVRRGAVSIARFAEQSASHQQILNPDTRSSPRNSVDPDGLYAYRLGFAAWIGGHHAACVRFMSKAIARRAQVRKALAAIFLSLLPRFVYLRLTGYAHVYR